MDETNEPDGVTTTETTLDIIHTLQDQNGARIDELAHYLDFAPSTIYRHLVTLRKNHYVRKKGDRYELGLRFLTLGGHAQVQQPGFNIVKTKVDQLAAKTGERSQFIVEEHGFRIYLYTQTGENAVETGSSVGKRGYLHSSSAGKAILAGFTRNRVEKIVNQHGLEALTENTITDQEELFSEIDGIRDRGYAYNIEESTVGLRAIGTTITSKKDGIIGSISISGPAHRLKGDRFQSELPDLLLGSANEIELRLDYSRRNQ